MFRFKRKEKEPRYIIPNIGALPRGRRGRKIIEEILNTPPNDMAQIKADAEAAMKQNLKVRAKENEEQCRKRREGKMEYILQIIRYEFSNSSITSVTPELLSEWSVGEFSKEDIKQLFAACFLLSNRVICKEILREKNEEIGSEHIGVFSLVRSFADIYVSLAITHGIESTLETAMASMCNGYTEDEKLLFADLLLTYVQKFVENMKNAVNSGISYGVITRTLWITDVPEVLFRKFAESLSEQIEEWYKKYKNR